MRLNIYIISHPIIQILSSSIIYDKNNTISSFNYKYLGVLLIYEMMRKNIKTKSIYIKNINSVKKNYYIDQNQKYYMITNLINTYTIISDIKILMPEIEIIDIKNKENICDKINENNKLNIGNINNNIIIFDVILYESSIIELMMYIRQNTKISINNIQIACLACYNQLLDKLGNEYPTLNIYTTKIIQ